MKSLFAPATAVMNHLNYAAKFVLIGLLFLIPLGYVAWLQISSQEEQRDFNEKEHFGFDYTTPVFRMLKQAQLRRMYSVALLANSSSYESAYKQSGDEIDRLIPVIDALDAKYKVAFEKEDPGTRKVEYIVTEKWDDVKKSWTEVKDKRFKSADETYAAYNDLCGKISDLILNGVANYSNLILDPDLDSYWQMDAFTGRLPTISDDLGRASTLCMLLSTRKAMTADERLELTGYYKELDSTMSGLLINMDVVYGDFEVRHDKSQALKTKLDPLVKSAQDESARYMNLLKDKFINASEVAVIPIPELENGAAASLEKIYTLYEVMGPEMDRLIQERVTKYQNLKTAGIRMTVGAAVALVYVFLGFYFSVQTSIVKLGQATQRMLAGTTERFRLDSRDELAQVAESYNEINGALVEARSLRSKVENENKQILQVVAAAAAGNLTVRAELTDGAPGNVTGALNQMLDSWSGLTNEIKKLTVRTESAIAEIRAAAERMTEGATQQAIQIGNISGAVLRMSGSIQGVSDNAETAAAAAKRTQEAARDGSDSVQNVVRGMELLRSNVQAGAKKIKTLGDRSMDITTIIATIKEISDQSKILSLNAAIEAARAGEHGRGFSVVADAVRKLAERTSAATQEIERLIKSIQADTNESVAAIEQQTQVVEEESQVVSRAGDSLARIQEVSTQSAELIGAISATARQQVEGASTVVQSIEHVSQISHETQAGAGNTLKITGDLASLASQLARTVGQFKTVGGAPVAVPTEAAPVIKTRRGKSLSVQAEITQ